MLHKVSWCLVALAAGTSICTAQSVGFDFLTGNQSDDSEPQRLMGAGSGHIQWKIRYGQVAARGANLGGWLVSEQWMTEDAPMWANLPSDLANTGEFQVLTKGGNTAQRLAGFDDLHKTFVMEKDIAAIAAAGLNTVRVPVGYWIAGGDPHDPDQLQEWNVFPKNTIQYLDTLIRDWAWKHQVAVLVSIHAAKGSQNGQDHSAPSVSKTAYWSQYQSNVKNAIYVAEFLANRYKSDDAFLGLGLMNEPMAQTDENVLNQYYKDAYKAVRATGTDCILTIMPLLYKQTADNLVGFMEAPAFTNVWVEWHPYFLWGYESKSANDLVTQSIANDFQQKISTWNNRPNANKMFFGEWSLANAGQYSNPDSAEYRAFAQAMVKVMNQAKAGWTYWSWRVYGDDRQGAYNAWSMRSVFNKPVVKKILIG